MSVPAVSGHDTSASLLARLRARSAASDHRAHIPALLALLPTIVACRTLTHETPLSYDHATHLFKAWHFWTEMLGRFRVRGWSHYWGFGFPSDELVPCGGEVWVSLFRALTLGQLSWLRTYALAFAAFLLFKALAVFWFTRRYFGPAAAVLAAWLASVDPGATLEGGWNWHSYWGVWPVTLSMSFTLCALVRFDDALAHHRRRDVARAAGWLGAALLTHQLALLVCAVVLPLLALDHLARPSRLRWGGLLAGALAAGLGFALAAFTLLPFMGRGDATQDLGRAGDSLGAVLERLVQLRTFKNIWPPVHALAIFGAVLAVRRRLSGSVFMAGAAAVFVLLSSNTLIADLHLERVLASLIKIEAGRMLLVAKLFWFPLAGYALAVIGGAALGRARARAPQVVRKGSVIGAALALALPVIAYALPTQGSPIEKLIRGEHELRYFHDFEALVRWSREERDQTSEHYRIAYHSWEGNHLPTLAAVFDRTPIYNAYFTPTQIFDKLPLTDEPALLRALSVKYVVSPSDVERSDFVLYRRFGQLRVYRFTGYRPEPFTVLGKGRAELVELEPERVVIRVTGADEDTRLAIHVAAYDRWEARSGGSVLPITTVPVYGAEYPILMEVPASDGEIVLEYVYRRSDWVGLVLSLGALPLVGFLWASGRRGRPLPGLDVKLGGLGPERLAIAAGLLALAVASLLLAKARSRAALLPRDSLFHHLEGPELSLAGEACSKASALEFTCGSHPVRADIISGVWGMHLCMHAPDVGPLVIDARLPIGAFVFGKYDPAEQGGGSIRASIDGRSIGEVATRPSGLCQQAIAFDTRADQGREARLHVEVTGAALHCFDLRVVP